MVTKQIMDFHISELCAFQPKVAQVNELACSSCLHSYLKSSRGTKTSYKFNYDYSDSLDILSCHESHNNIFIETERIEQLLNFKELTVEVAKSIIDSEQSLNQDELCRCVTCDEIVVR